MYKHYKSSDIASILNIWLNDDTIEDMGEIETLFKFMLQKLNTPSWRFKNEAELSDTEASYLVRYSSVDDYFFDALNSLKISFDKVKSLVEDFLISDNINTPHMPTINKPISDLPVMKLHCKTCPFKPDCNGMWQDTQLANEVISRTLFKAQQICHGTEGVNRKANNSAKVHTITTLKFMIEWVYHTYLNKMKEYIIKRLAELNSRLNFEKAERERKPLELGLNSQVRDHVIITYVFAICELEEVLKNE